MISARAAKTVAGSALSPPGARPFVTAFDSSAMLSRVSTFATVLGRDEPTRSTTFVILASPAVRRGRTPEVGVTVAATGPTGEIGVSTVTVLEREPAGQGAGGRPVRVHVAM